MKIYIITDMEGVSGICSDQQVQRDQAAYAEGQRLLIGDINAAVAGAFDGGATEVVVNDGHGGGFNLILEQMDPRARYERPNGGPRQIVVIDVVRRDDASHEYDGKEKREVEDRERDQSSAVSAQDVLS